MLARRIFLFVALLLLLGTIAAAIAPDDDDSPRTTGVTTGPDRVDGIPFERFRPKPRIRVVRATLPGKAARAQVGDLLRLEVRHDGPDTVVIRGLDLVEAVTKESPARFETQLHTPGRFNVRLLESGRSVGVVRVRRQ